MEGRENMKLNNILLRFNRLEFKLAVALFIITFTSLLVYSSIVSKSVLDSLVIVEKAKIKETTEVVSRVSFNMASNIERVVKDYSLWDEAYKNVLENDTKWIKDNFIDWLPNNFEMDLILVADKKKNILGSYGMEQKYLLRLLDNTFVDGIVNERYSERTKYPCGFIDINNDLYIFSAMPIVSYNPQDLPAGITLIGKKVDSAFVENIESETGEIVFFTHRNSIITTKEHESYIKKYFEIYEKDFEEENVKIYDNATIRAKKSIHDFQEKEVAQLYIVKDRNIFITVTESIEKSITLAIFISFAIVGSLLIPLKKFVIDPIRSFQNQICSLRNATKNQHFDVEGLNAFINLTTIYNEIAVSLDIHKKENSTLKVLSSIDALTTLYNERYFQEYFNTRILESNMVVSAIFCDVDNFSLVNQIYGYNMGDLLLIRVASAIRKELGDSGTAFRLANDSFMLLLEEVDKSEAYKIAENIRCKISDSSFIRGELENVLLSMSFGIVSYPEDVSDLSIIIDKAEKALYYAMNNGGNQCQFYRNSIDSIAELGREEYVKRKMQVNSVYALAVAIDAKDNYTGNHSQTVSKFVMDLAEKLGSSEKEKDDLRMGALLHDCGKIGIPDDIVRKPGKLSLDEWNIIKSHPLLGYDIAKCIIDDPFILSCVRNHHERWDGKGYPDGLSKLNIPYYARIVCIADAYHAMISDRPYRPGLCKEIAVSELRKQSGTQFDPSLVELFIEVVDGYDI